LFGDTDTAYIVVASPHQLQVLREASRKELVKSSDALTIDSQRQSMTNSAVMAEVVRLAQGHDGKAVVSCEEVIVPVSERMARLFNMRLTTPRQEAYHWGMLETAWLNAANCV
jgi:hypothetical protein